MAVALCLCLLAVLSAVSACGLGTIPRLPRTINPRQYHIAVATDPLGRHFDGNVTIEVEVVEETDNITLHSRGLTLGPAQLTNQDNVETVKIESQQEAAGGLLVVKVNQTLGRGTYSLAIPFHGRLNSARQRGYYRVKTGQHDTDWLSGTVFEYDHAREAFPCFDEPEMKARFRVSLAHHKNYSALSNMPVLTSEPYGKKEGWVIDHFDNSPVMSSYLVAYHLMQWSRRQVLTEEGLQVSVWAPEKHLRWANNSFAVAPATLAFLTDYTGLKDPMPKLDMVLVPRFQGALENWGVVSFMPSAVLYKPHWEGELRRVLNSKVVAHELSHFWFGNLVTPRWWDALWLSEGAATFFASLILNKLEPEWDQLTEDTEEYLTTTFLSNALSMGQPLSHPVECAQDLRSVSYAPYYKGFSLFRMLYYSLGPEKFQESIRHYFSNHQYKTATPEMFFKAFEFSYEGLDLETLMHSWTYKQGLPVVSVNRSSGQLTLTQDPFIINLLGTDEYKQDDVKWWVPVSYISQSQRLDLSRQQSLSPGKPVAWFSEDITLPDPAQPTEWLLLNEEAAGTYHVRYDEENLELLKASLNSSLEDIPALNRFQLVLDYGLFALAGLEPLSEVLDLLDYLENEKHFAPWAAGLRTFWRLDQRLRGTPTQHKLRERVRHLLVPEFTRLGLRSSKNDSVPTLRQRRQIAQFACLYKLPECVKRAKRLYVKWESQTVPDKINPVPPEVRLTVYCSSVRTFGKRAWNFLWERATHSRDPISRDSLFTALGCTTNYTLLHSFVESKVNSSGSQDVTKHDFTKVIQGLIQYNEDIGPVLDFMERSMLKLKSVSKKKMRWNQNMLRDLAQQITSPEQLKQLANLNSMTKVWSQEETANVQKMVKHNALWRKQNVNTL